MKQGQIVYDRVMYLALLLHRYERVIQKNLYKNLLADLGSFREAVQDAAIADGPNIVGILTRAFRRTLQISLEKSIREIQQIVPAMADAVNRATLQRPEMEFSPLDPFGLGPSWLNDGENSFQVIADALGITEDEAREIFASFLLFGFTLFEFVENFALIRSIQFQNEIASQISLLRQQAASSNSIYGLQVEDLKQVIVQAAKRQDAAVIDKFLPGISAILFGVFNKMLGVVSNKNPTNFFGLVIVGVLDSNICNYCRSRHGDIVTILDGVFTKSLPTYHARCRCISVPVRFGGTSVDTNFGEWLARQPTQVQRSLLGPKYASYKRGEVKVSTYANFMRLLGLK